MFKILCSLRFIQLENRFNKYLKQIDSQTETGSSFITFDSIEK